MSKKGHQCAALPFKEVNGETMILLITSRETGRWILPKGWVEKSLSDSELAAKEAYEEGGIIGETRAKPIFSYRYAKRLPNELLDCSVKVFPLRVTELLETWPESTQRRREWFTLAQAAMTIDDSDLVTRLLRLAVPNAEIRLS